MIFFRLTDVVTLQARKLDPVTLHFGGGAKESVGERGDWMRAATTKPVLDHRVMDKWAIVYQSRDEKIAKTFCQSLVQQCPKMGIQVLSHVSYCENFSLK